MLGIAAVLAAVGAVVWSRTIADEGDERADDDVVMDEPGEFVEPGSPTNPPRRADRLPDVELETSAGTTVTLESDGRPMVVNLWYSTCAPCARELGDFAEVHAEIGDHVRFVGVNPLDTPDAMQRFAADRDVTYELLRDVEAGFTNELGVVGFPVTLFVGSDGVIVDETGPIDDGELRELIAEHWGLVA